jgi:hypothetical protein
MNDIQWIATTQKSQWQSKDQLTVSAASNSKWDVEAYLNQLLRRSMHELSSTFQLGFVRHQNGSTQALCRKNIRFPFLVPSCPIAGR